MIGAGTFINPLIKIVTTVAILAAIYFFFVKPALDTTESFSNSVNESIGRSFDSGNDLQENIQKDINESLREANRATEQAFNNPTAERAQKRGECISKAGGDVERIQACSEKFPP